MRTNVKAKSALTEITHEGAPAYGNLTPYQELRRSVLSCFLWEDTFYEEGKDIAARIMENALKVDPYILADLAIEARRDFNLRHASLLLLLALAKTGKGTNILSHTIPAVVRRADELTELLALYWKDGKKPLAAQIKKGLRRAVGKFDAYQLAKYNRDNAVKLRDVLMLVHPKPQNDEQSSTWKKLLDKTLESPDTWEVALSAGADKKATFERLLNENNLGYLALLRNLRNMVQADVSRTMIQYGFNTAKGCHNVLPFRFVAAARACPQLEPMIDEALCRRIEALDSLRGTTVVLVDVSGSMDDKLSQKSDLRRIDAAAALASVIKSDFLRVFTFSNKIVEVAPRRGMAGVDAVITSQGHCGTYLGTAIDTINNTVKYDRIIVITDEQSHDSVGAPKGKGYMINVASYQNGVGYGPWTHIDGFSERVIDFIHEAEAAKDL